MPETTQTRGPTLSGHLHLRAEARTDGQTYLAHQSFRTPFHISKPYWDGHALQVQIVNPTAGMLEGDSLELHAEAASRSRLLLTTPSATRAFMMRSGAAECRQTFTVETGGWLEYSPEPLFPHRDCNYKQTTLVHVAEGGDLYFTDSLAPGRVGRGECWEWRRLQLSLTVTHASEPVLRERLDSSGESMKRHAERHNQPIAWHGTVVVVSEKLSSDDSALEKIRDLHRGHLGIGLTRLRKTGWIVRIIAPTGLVLRDTMAEIRTLFATTLPALRSKLRKL
jgi:urease accessory protein